MIAGFKRVTGQTDGTFCREILSVVWKNEETCRRNQRSGWWRMKREFELREDGKCKRERQRGSRVRNSAVAGAIAENI
jgi:hypothetical protein